MAGGGDPDRVLLVTSVVRRGWFRDWIVVVAMRDVRWTSRRLGHHWMGGPVVRQSEHALAEGAVLTVKVSARRRVALGAMLSLRDLI